MNKPFQGTYKTWSTPVSKQKSKLIPCNLCGGQRFVKALDCEGFSFVRCTQCGLLQSNPQVEKKEVSARYRELHGAEYLAYELENEGPFLALQELALGDVDFYSLPKGRVLDVGCATGALLQRLREQGWTVTGIELCGPSAKYARDVRGLNVLNSTLEDAHFPDLSFDVVLASHLIEHLNDPRSFVQESHRILRDGGYLFVTTPNSDGFQARLFGSRWRSAIFDHLYLFSKKTLGRLLREQGFAVEKTVTWGGLASGMGPKGLKVLADRWAKRFGFGDVMILRSRRQSPTNH
jgi:2-polyprenyl-3-methyl-5-hydroxy-6-metoxy-1,4-benzoquinol methylase